MRARFAKDKMYTMTGSILLAVNPFQRLPIYGEDKMPRYKGKKLGSPGTEPHVYAMAEAAYATMRKTGCSQSLAVSGESGAGKTETNKGLMNYLAWRSRQPDDEEAAASVASSGSEGGLANMILQADPILEAFGNAKTSRNNNSSRFGKFLLVGMTKDGQVLGATTRHYLLEKSRVPWQAKGERNYHSFYQMIAGHTDKTSLGLTKPAESFFYLSHSGVVSARGIDDVANYTELRSSMAAIKMSAEEQEGVFTLLAGLLHLGSVSFVGDESAEVAPAAKESLDFMIKLLGMPDIVTCLLKRTMTTPSGTTVLDNSPEKAALARDALAKALYSRLFDHLLVRVNESIKGKMTDDALFIGLLDVFGFEFFEVNSYEQLCINFANEKLQQFFLRFIFKAELELYTEEELKFEKIEYQDNQGAIDIVEKSPSGILRLLDETCKKPGSTDKNFCDSVATTHKKSNFYMQPRAGGFRQYREDQAFVVRHFAGDVCYLADSFLEKNNDTLHPDFTSRLSSSTHKIIAHLYAEAPGEAKGGKKKGGFNSVSRKYISQLSSLMSSLESTQSHFVRCLKPNKELKPSLFTPALVLQQLRCSGTIDAVRLMSAGFPTRMPFTSIHGRFASFMPDFVQNLPPPLFCESLALALAIPSDAFQLGKSMIFFKAGKGAALEELAAKSTEEVVKMLTENEEFMEKVKDYQKRRIALQKIRNAILKHRQKQWIRRIMVINQLVANEKFRSQNRMKGMKRAEAVLLSEGGWHRTAVSRIEKRREQERRAAEEAAALKAKEEFEKRASQVAEKERMERLGAEKPEGEAEKPEEEAEKPAVSDAEVEPVLGERIETVQGQPIEVAESAPKEPGEATPESGSSESITRSPSKRAAKARGRWQGSFLALAFNGKHARKAKVDPKADDKPLRKAKIGAVAMPEHTKVVVTLTRSQKGSFGINVDHALGSEAVIVSFVETGSESDTKNLVIEGDLIQELAYNEKQRDDSIKAPTLEQTMEAFKTAGDTIELTIMRMPPVLLLNSAMQMQVGAESLWENFNFKLFSNHTISFEKTDPPFYNGTFSLRKCVGLQLHQRPGGDGGEIVIEMMGGHRITFRCGNTTIPKAWHREICFLQPEIVGAQELKSGWLRVKTEQDASNAHPRRCRVVIASSGRLSCFADASGRSQRLGAMDIRYAEMHVLGGKGNAVELHAYEKTWVLSASSQDELVDWLAALRSVVTKEATQSRGELIAALNEANGAPPDAAHHADDADFHASSGLVDRVEVADIFQRQNVEEKVREGFAELRVLSEGQEIAWTKSWFVLTSSRLEVFTESAKSRADAEKKKGRKSQVVGVKPEISVQLSEVEHVEGSHGADEGEENVLEISRADSAQDDMIRFRLATHDEMQTWLGALQTSVAAVKTQDRSQNETICTMRNGLMKSASKGFFGMKKWHSHYYVLQAWQSQHADDDVDVKYELLRFKTAKDAMEKGLSRCKAEGGGRLSLSGLEGVRKGASNELKLIFGDGAVTLRTSSGDEQEQWFRMLDAIRCGQDPTYTPTLPTTQEITPIEAAAFQLQVKNTADSDKWQGTTFTLRSDGTLASPHGSIDMRQTLGVWSIGKGEWRRLQIVNPDTVVTLASDNVAQMDSWAVMLQDLSPGKHVTEMKRGWMDKRGVRSGMWKQRFFVLLSSHELLMFTSETSRTAKVSWDLRKVKECKQVNTYVDEGYDSAFLIEGDDINLTVCLDEKGEMREWMAIIEKLRSAAGAASQVAIENQKQAETSIQFAKQRKQPGQNGAAALLAAAASRISYLSSTRTVDGHYYLVDEGGRLSSARWAVEGGKQLDQQHDFQDRRRRKHGVRMGGALKAGWLFKCSQFDATDWKRRYFVLRREAAHSGKGHIMTLSYYDTPESAQTVWHGGGTIDMGEATTIEPRPEVKMQGRFVDDQNGEHGAGRNEMTFHMHCFEVNTDERPYLLSAPSDAELKAWMSALAKKPGKEHRSPRISKSG